MNINQSVVSAVFGFCDSLMRRTTTANAAELATLTSKWSAM